MRFDPSTEAGDYVAPVGLYEANKARPFLGNASCSARTLVAGEWTELVVTYEVGGVGLADGAWIKLAFKFYSDWALFQTSDPTAPNYVSVEYQAGPLVPGQSPATVQQLKVRFDQKGHERPFQKAVIVDVVDGYLNPGDRIVLRLGDRRRGGAGTRVQTFVEKDFRLRVFIDPLGSSKFAEVPGDLLIDIVPGPPVRLQAIAPRLVGADTPFDLIVRADDAWGNTCRGLPLKGTVRIAGPDGAGSERPFTLAKAGWAVARLEGFAFDRPGEWSFTAGVEDARVAAATAFVDVDADGSAPRALYGDLHVHSDDTVGTNDTLYNLSYGRDVAGLDVLGYTANDFNITEKRWDLAVALIHELNEPGRFVCFPGTEWCGNSSAGGDRNVVFLRDGKPQFPFDDRGRLVRSVEWNEQSSTELKPGAWPVDELYAAYASDPEGHLLIPHVGGRRCVLDWHHPNLERLIEIGSAWGQFHWLYAEALQRGYHVGACANSDEHQGRCGGGVPATAVFGSRGGLTGILADEFDRAGVARALRARHTFATTGERSYASLRHGVHRMGDVYDADATQPLRYRVLGDQGWEELALFDGERQVWSRDLHAECGHASDSIRLRLGGARIKDRYRAATWEGRIEIRGTPLLAFSAYGLDHPEQAVWREDASTLGFRTSTSGDQDTIELRLGRLHGARLILRARITAYPKVGDVLDPPLNVHAPEAGLDVLGEELLEGGCVRVELDGTELHATMERITARPLPRALEGEIDLRPLPLRAGREHALFLVGRQRDQSRVWTSALFASM